MNEPTCFFYGFDKDASFRASGRGGERERETETEESLGKKRRKKSVREKKRRFVTGALDRRAGRSPGVPR